MSAEGPAALVNQKHRSLYIQVLDLKHQYTSGDRIDGVVRIDPTARPRNVTIVFTGLTLLHDKDAVPSKATYFKFFKQLFISTGAGDNFDILRQGTASDGRVELPFNFTFPHTATLPPPSDRSWWHPKDNFDHPRFQHSPGFILPPSCSPASSATNGILVPKVVYYLEARVDTTLKVRQELFFVPPAPQYDLALLEPNLNFGLTLPKHYCGYKFIRTRKLSPGYNESSKFGKLKDKLVDKELFFGIESYTEVPHVKFNIFETPARVLVIGALVPISVSVHHLGRSESVPIPPDLYLRRVRVRLHSALHTFLPAPQTARKGAKESIDVTQETITLLDKKFDKADHKLLYDGLNLLEIEQIRLPTVEKKLLPSFTSYGMALEYQLQINIWGECADRKFSAITCREHVQVVPDQNMLHPHATDLPGPAYEEVDPLAAHGPGNSPHPVDTIQHVLPPLVLQHSIPPLLPPPPYVDYTH